MISDIGKLFEKASSPGDIATVLIFGTGGFLVDAGLNAVGFLEPGVVGITAASGALGVKKAVESALTRRRERKALEQKRTNEKEKAGKLRALLGDDKRYSDLAQRLERELKLFDSGIVEIDDLKANVDQIIRDYRSQSQG